MRKTYLAKAEGECPWDPDAWSHEIVLEIPAGVDIMRGKNSWKLAAQSITGEAALRGARFILPIEATAFWNPPGEEDMIACNATLIIDPDGCGAIRISTPDYKYVRTCHMFVEELFDMFI